MSVTAESVKQLRERTGAGMMECKRALVETGGDLDAAAELMRKHGLAKADKKAARVAAEGVVMVEKAADGRAAAMVEVNCETDFVAREQDFGGFAADVARVALAARVTSVEALLAAKLPAGETVDERRRALIAKWKKRFNSIWSASNCRTNCSRSRSRCSRSRKSTAAARSARRSYRHPVGSSVPPVVNWP